MLSIANICYHVLRNSSIIRLIPMGHLNYLQYVHILDIYATEQYPQRTNSIC